MSDKRPIGVFDSGIGGLTVLKSLLQYLPHEDYIYLGDTARTPYGNKSAEAVRQYAGQITSFLVSQNVKAIVVACNTVSAAAIETVKEKAWPVPVFEVISPLVKQAAHYVKQAASSRVGVLATRRTVRSGQYPKAMASIVQDDVSVEQIACPIFVELVEEGIWDGPFAKAAVDHYLAAWQDDAPEAVLLACTHFPLLKPLIESFLPEAEVMESGPAVSLVVADALDRQERLNESEHIGERQFYCTDTIESFVELAESFLGQPVENIRQLDWKDVPC